MLDRKTVAKEQDDTAARENFLAEEKNRNTSFFL